MWNIKTLITGHHYVSKNFFLPEYPESEMFWVPIISLAIWNDDTKILVDTSHNSAKWICENLCPATTTEEEELVPMLSRELGWETDDIDYIINTHLHIDHCGQNYRFPNAKFIVSRKEWDAAHNPVPWQEALYHEPMFDEKAVLPSKWTFTEGDVDFMDGIRLIETPGHSAGHISVLIDTKEGVVCMAGDACVTLRNINENIEPNAKFDGKQLLASYQRIRDNAERVIPGHEQGIRQYQTDGFPLIKK